MRFIDVILCFFFFFSWGWEAFGLWNVNWEKKLTLLSLLFVFNNLLSTWLDMFGGV